MVGGILAVAAGLVLSGQVTTVRTSPDRINPFPEQYMMSCAPGETYGYTAGAAGDFKPITNNGEFSANSAQNVLLPWGSQWRWHQNTTDLSYLCLHQTLNTTVTMGIAGGTTGGAGAGNVTFDSATSIAGRGRCITLGQGYEYFQVSRPDWICSGPAGSRSPATCRTGRCTAVSNTAVLGGPCIVNADCGAASGVCSSAGRGPDGVYVSIGSAGASALGSLQRCGQ